MQHVTQAASLEPNTHLYATLNTAQLFLGDEIQPLDEAHRVIQLGKQYQGSELLLEHEGRESQLKSGYADVLINRCEIPHGVNRVQSGTRASLVFFLSTPPWTNPTCTTRKSDRSDRPTTRVRTRGRRRQKESKA
jgi:hypothetical protein